MIAPFSHRRRWRQFSLKTLLFLTFVSAVACAWLAARREEKRREWATVESLRKSGVYLAYDWQEAKLQEPYGAPWLRKLLGDNFFSEVVRAYLRDDRIGDDTLAQLGELQSLRELSVNGVNVTQAGFTHLRGLKHLEQLQFFGENINDECLLQLDHLTNVRSLGLQHTSVTDAGLAPIEHWPHLKSLLIERPPLPTMFAGRRRGREAAEETPTSPITDACLAYIAHHKHLNWVNLKFVPITNAGAAHLRGLTSLKMLDLVFTEVTDEGLANLAGLTELEYLNLADTPVTDAGMAHLQNMKKLKTLILARADLHDAGLKLISQLASLEHLTLSGVRVTDQGAQYLSKLSRLTSLSIDSPWGEPPNLELTDRGTQSLANLTDLERFTATRTGFGDGAVEHLGKLKKMRTLQIGETKLTPAGLRRLVQLLPGTQIMPSPAQLQAEIAAKSGDK